MPIPNRSTYSRRRTLGSLITTGPMTGGHVTDDGPGTAISEMLHLVRIAAIRFRMRCNGSRTVHFEN